MSNVTVCKERTKRKLTNFSCWLQRIEFLGLLHRIQHFSVLVTRSPETTADRAPDQRERERQRERGGERERGRERKKRERERGERERKREREREREKEGERERERERERGRGGRERSSDGLLFWA